MFINTKFVNVLISIITILFIISSCKKNGANYIPDCTGAAKSFSIDVYPILQSSCALNSNCHGVGSNNGVGELLIYTKIFTNRSAIRSAVASGEMPLNGSLTDTEKNTILCWIDSGAPNN